MPRASYIPEHVWRMRKTKLGLKKGARSLNETLAGAVMASAFQQWKGSNVHDCCKKLRILRELLAAAISYSAQKIKEITRRCKTEALSALMRGMGRKTSGQLFCEIQALGIGGRAHKKTP